MTRLVRVGAPWLATCATVMVVAACNGLGSCRNARGVAELVAFTGRVERSEGALAAWRAAPIGSGFALGDAVRTGPASTARVRVGAGGFNLGASSMVRFVSSPAAGAPTSLRVESGAAELEPMGEDLVVDTAVGRARLERNSRVRVEAGGPAGDGGVEGEPRLQVVLGRVVLERAGAAPLTVVAGQRMVVRVAGPPVVESVTAAATPRAARDAGSASARTAEPNAALDAGTVAAATTPDAAATPDSGATALLLAAGAADAGALVASADAGVAASVDAGAPARVAMVTGLTGGRAGATVLDPGGEGTWRPFGQGRQQIAPGSRIRLPAGTRLALRRGTAFHWMQGPAEIVVGDEGEPLARPAPAESAVASASGANGGAGSAAGGADAGTQASATASATAGPDAGTGTGTSTGATAAAGAASHGAAVEGETGANPAFVAATVGESSLIHSTASATPVRVRFPSACPSGAMVQTAGRGAITARGAEAAVLVLPPGRHRYSVRCLAAQGGRPTGRTVGTGTITVVRDTGDAPMPRRAPHSTVDADGRNYSVLYQNLLPEITFRWSRAPAGAGVHLHVRDRNGRVRRFERGPGDSEVGLTSGQITEGSYQFWFSAGTARSPETALRIAFDNAARSASLTEPADAPLTPGRSVRVAGTALAGSVVTVGATRLPLDSQNRFHGDVTVPRDEPALTIRIAHPARGVQYYVRRIAGAVP